ncbi:MAG TPA: glutamine-hydrolyzing carbamoyl-phosphate synthase small subunit [Haliangiales bacterium]|nr:glutamine-hydrolyzing carbamoyl-phosphate synthase small subunit [Haliangiales bacterium]
MRKIALLALEDGTTYRGEAFGADGETYGEVVFNTAITGYQEVLTDPSYRGQIVAMTAPEIGNVGTNGEDEEAPRPVCAGFVVRELAPAASSWRAERSLDAYLVERGIVGIAGIDTRALTRRLRTAGAQRGAISTTTLDPAELVERVRRSPGMEGRDLVREVTCAATFTWDEPSWVPPEERPGRTVPPADLHVVAYDFGMKRNILHRLRDHGCRVTVVPATTTGAEALAHGADGYFLSNGPGDPAALPYAAEAASALIASGKPVFGICLGHQILGHALGGTTYKLRFGHHGANHPVMELATGKVEITSQNHGFAVDVDSLAGKATLTHVNLNDRTVEGMRLDDRPVFSVQYHPEASPGPHDAAYLFQRFVSLMKS